ncbi:hypothetical protein V5799_013130 [Amblyomma americanum]|uniref:alpha-1,2-Mannosidase n=1 Tax=Amblyomma americanum TaxID=6943 RepID=A0AAQ4E6Q8_AMBAM
MCPRKALPVLRRQRSCHGFCSTPNIAVMSYHSTRLMRKIQRPQVESVQWLGAYFLHTFCTEKLGWTLSLAGHARGPSCALLKMSPHGCFQVGNHIDVQLGVWTATDSGIGAGVDSYYEYLVKGAIMLQMPELMHMFKEYEKTISKYMKRDDWYFWVENSSGKVTMPVFQSLEAFWPGLLSLIGDLENARKSLYNYHQVWREYGFTPEFYEVVHGRAHPKRDGYPLRPELVESLVYLYQATKDPHFLEIGVDILESIMHSAKTECGYATIKKVGDHTLDDRMESFFLAETTKYLYLLFTPDHFIHNNGSSASIVQTSSGECVIDTGAYVFNTEAHPIDVAAVHCCSADKAAEDRALQDFAEELDLSRLILDEQRDEFVRLLRPREGNEDSGGIGDSQNSQCTGQKTKEDLTPPPSTPSIKLPARDPILDFSGLLPSKNAEKGPMEQTENEEEEEEQEEGSHDDDGSAHTLFGFLNADKENGDEPSDSELSKAEDEPMQPSSNGYEATVKDGEEQEPKAGENHARNGLDEEANNLSHGVHGETVSSGDSNSFNGERGKLQPQSSGSDSSVEAQVSTLEEESSEGFLYDEDEFDDEMNDYKSRHSFEEENGNENEVSDDIGEYAEDGDTFPPQGVSNQSQPLLQAGAPTSRSTDDVTVPGTVESAGTKDGTAALKQDDRSTDGGSNTSKAASEHTSSDSDILINESLKADIGWKSEVKEVELAPVEEEVIFSNTYFNESRNPNIETGSAQSPSLQEQTGEEVSGEKGAISTEDATECIKRPAKEPNGWLMLRCPSQPFTSRLAFRGEMFNVD